MNNRRTRMMWSVLAATVLTMPVSACRPSTQDAQAEPPKSAVKPAPPKKQVLFFDKALRVEDDTANAFVERIVKLGVGGAYDQFRLLWVPSVEPISKATFDKNWHDVQRVTIRIVTRVDLGGASVGSPPIPQPGFAMVADVQFDPKAIQPGTERGRRIALTMLKVDGQWRLAGAPKGLRDWLDQQIELAQPPAAEQVSSPAP